MTEKRFTIDKVGGVFYIFDNGTLLPINDGELIVELLNALHEENQHLKGALKELKEIGNYQAMRIQELDDENEQLRNNIKEAYQTERTMIGKSVLKQLLKQME